MGNVTGRKSWRLSGSPERLFWLLLSERRVVLDNKAPKLRARRRRLYAQLLFERSAMHRFGSKERAEPDEIKGKPSFSFSLLPSILLLVQERGKNNFPNLCLGMLLIEKVYPSPRNIGKHSSVNFYVRTSDSRN